MMDNTTMIILFGPLVLLFWAATLAVLYTSYKIIKENFK